MIISTKKGTPQSELDRIIDSFEKPIHSIGVHAPDGSIQLDIV